MSEAPPYAGLVPWRGQRLAFAFGIDQWRALQRETGFGPWVLEGRVSAKMSGADELRHILTQGLLGGGMPLAEADKLVTQNCGPEPGRLSDALMVARLALGHALFEADKDVLGESTGVVKTPRRRSPAGNSPSAKSLRPEG